MFFQFTELGKRAQKLFKLKRYRPEEDVARELEEFKNKFISFFSHDLKTPLAKINAIIDRLIREHPNLSFEITDELKNIEKTSKELTKLITDILKVSRMEAKTFAPSKEVVDMNRLVEEAVQRVQFLADQRNINLILDLEPLFSMEGDPSLILEVIVNLIENAIKYSPLNRNIIIRTHELNNKVFFEVIDEGKGIPQEEIPKVTEKFYRSEANSSNVKGTGLGLYLSKFFVELHRGELFIESQLDKGTKVSFFLPIAEQS